MPVTPRRRLRRGDSVWTDSWGLAVPTRRLTRDGRADVVVVGGGISGALVAWEAMRRGRHVTLLDRRRPGLGSTRASTALLLFEIDTPLHALAERTGWRRAVRAYRRSHAAVADLAALVRGARVRCGLGARDSLYLAGTAYGRRAFAAEAAARARAGLPGTLLSAAALRDAYGIARTAALVSDGAAVANPAQLTAGLLRRLAARGARLHREANVVEARQERRGMTLLTASGVEVAARHVVFCTGYEVPFDVPRGGHRIRRTWVIGATPRTPPPAWLRSTVVWEASDPYLYLRLTEDGRIVAGGRDEEDGSGSPDAAVMARKARAIAGDVRAVLPELALTVTHRWDGAFGDSPAGLPLIDRLPGARDAWVVAGFGGNGITYSMIAAQVVGAALQGRRDPDAALYALVRRPTA